MTNITDENTNLIWVDLEMTGLNLIASDERIMEIAVIITDKYLNIIAEGPNLIIHVEDDILNNMVEWCVKTHGKSGLTEKCRKSNISIADAEMQVLEFVRKYTLKGKNPLAGNSVYSDKKFIEKYMPQFFDYLYYRIVDVSSIKELYRRWFPEVFANVPNKSFMHTALIDIKESIEELKYYKKHMLNMDTNISSNKVTNITDENTNIIWVDLEMTGLNLIASDERIMEIAVIITDKYLNIIAEGPNLIIHVEDNILNNMIEWCAKTHGKSGLTEKCRQSNISIADAETQVLEFVKKYTEKGKNVLAGNSVYSDKKFIEAYMSQFFNYFHYRLIDVSSMKELCRRWLPEVFSNVPKKLESHTALSDIKESIEELRYYKKHMLNMDIVPT